MARRPQNDERSSRKAWRFGSWAAVAVVALAGAGFAALTSSGSHGSTKASAETADLGREAEARRLTEAVRLLAADRDRLAARLAVLERNMGDMTGSIAPGANRPIPGASPGTGVPPLLGPSPPPPVATVPPAAPPSKPLQASPGPAIADPSTAADPGAIGSVATKTEFGVDLGGGPSIDALRALWTQVKAGNEQLFDGLRPVMSIREAARPGTFELRLLAGPLGNATAAARICATLAAAGLTCLPAVFDGQRLALK
jgi:hypothetical protein